MGKQRRQRKKLHLAPKEPPEPRNVPETAMSAETPAVPLLENSAVNIFAGLKIDIGSLNKNLVSDDVQSVKSFKSVKSDLALSKKDKLKLRREMFLKKLDLVNEAKKQSLLRKKRKNTAIIGDTNPLRDALPSLESLLKSRGNVAYCKQEKSTKPKGIAKAKKQKKQYIQGIKMYKQILKNKFYKKDPQNAISLHVKSVVEHEKKHAR